MWKKVKVLCSYDHDDIKFDVHAVFDSDMLNSEDGRDRVMDALRETFNYSELDDEDKDCFNECFSEVVSGGNGHYDGSGYFGADFFWKETFIHF